MRNLLLLLLLANIVYFLYGRYADDGSEVGIAIVEESELGPPLELAETVADVPDLPEEGGEGTDDGGEDGGSGGDDGEDGAEDDENQPIQLAAAVGRSCVSVGPFKTSSEADYAQIEFENDGIDGAVRATEGEVFIGHWVQVRDVPSRGDAIRMIATLQEGGLGDAYLVETEEEGMKISLGLFGDLARAERIELQAKSLGLPADIVPRTRAAMVYYVDLGLPPGRGASAIVSKYGEEMVLLRNRATCPSLR